MASMLLRYVAIKMLAGSTYQLMRNGMLIPTGIFAYCFTRTSFKRNQIWGAAIALVSLLIMAFSEIFESQLQGRF